jgi:hypothetical protein
MKAVRAKCVVGALLLEASLVCAAQLPATIVDAGLHRQWIIERDQAHPERPPRLVEVPWSASPGAGTRSRRFPAAAQPVVRAGMRVTLCWQDGSAAVRLTGTALDPGRIGDAIRVRAGLHGVVLRGVVRGPARVALEPGRP